MRSPSEPQNVRRFQSFRTFLSTSPKVAPDGKSEMTWKPNTDIKARMSISNQTIIGVAKRMLFQKPL